jgi:hypothetical protein
MQCRRQSFSAARPLAVLVFVMGIALVRAVAVFVISSTSPCTGVAHYPKAPLTPAATVWVPVSLSCQVRTPGRPGTNR